VGRKESLANRGSSIPLRVVSDAREDGGSGGGGGGSEGANGMRGAASRRGILWTPPPTLPELPPMEAMEVIGREETEGRERLPGYEETMDLVRPTGDGDGEEEALPLYREREDGGGGSGQGDTEVSVGVDNAIVYAEFMTTAASILQDYEVSTESLNQYLSER